MEQSINQTNPLQYQDLLLDSTLTQDMTKELSLPDYQPEIKRLLRITATVQPPTRYIGGGNIEFSGNVDFVILYSGDDGMLYSFPTSADYVLRTAADHDHALSYLPDDHMTCYAVIDSDMVNGRVAGPRKLTVRCRVRANVRAYGSCTPEEVWNGELCGTPQRLQQELSTARVLTGTSSPLTLRDEIIPDVAHPGEELRIISAYASVLPQEVTTTTDRVNCRGQLSLKLLLQQEIEPQSEGSAPPLPYVLQRNIPFSAEIPVTGLISDSEAIVQGSCTELSLVLEDGKILCEAELLLQAQTQHRELLQYTADLCCIGQHSRVTTTPLRSFQPIRCLHTGLSVHETLAAKDHALPPSCQPIDLCAAVIPDSVSAAAEGTRYLINGTVRYSLLYEADGEYALRELDLPFRCYADLNPTARQEMREPDAEYLLQITDAKARYDERDGKLHIDAEICLALRVWDCATFSPVSEVTVEQACAYPVGSRTIYYPMPDETLWTVAKRYCSSVEHLCDINHLTASGRADDANSLQGVRIIVI